MRRLSTGNLKLLEAKLAGPQGLGLAWSGVLGCVVDVLLHYCPAAAFSWRQPESSSPSHSPNTPPP